MAENMINNNVQSTIIKQDNPLKSFFRKSKLQISLPSSGKWYKNNTLAESAKNGLVNVLPMNAADDVKFKSGEITMTGKSTMDLIKSCIPDIYDPTSIPSIDIDPILLAIRLASYGEDFNVNLSVPKTKLIRAISFKIPDLINKIPSDPTSWDTNLQILNDDGATLELILSPISLGQIFNTTKAITAQRRSLSKLFTADTNIQDLSDKQIEQFDEGLVNVTKTAIDLICESIVSIKLTNADKEIINILENNGLGKQQINELIHSIDIEYFNAIRNHLDEQRLKFTIITDEITSTPEEIAAGADATWTAPIIVAGSDFFAK